MRRSENRERCCVGWGRSDMYRPAGAVRKNRLDRCGRCFGFSWWSKLLLLPSFARWWFGFPSFLSSNQNQEKHNMLGLAPKFVRVISIEIPNRLVDRRVGSDMKFHCHTRGAVKNVRSPCWTKTKWLFRRQVFDRLEVLSCH